MAGGRDAGGSLLGRPSRSELQEGLLIHVPETLLWGRIGYCSSFSPGYVKIRLGRPACWTQAGLVRQPQEGERKEIL